MGIVAEVCRLRGQVQLRNIKLPHRRKLGRLLDLDNKAISKMRTSFIMLLPIMKHWLMYGSFYHIFHFQSKESDWSRKRSFPVTYLFLVARSFQLCRDLVNGIDPSTQNLGNWFDIVSQTEKFDRRNRPHHLNFWIYPVGSDLATVKRWIMK